MPNWCSGIPEFGGGMFVRTADDLLPLFEVMDEVGRRVPIIAKIEKFEAVRNLASILRVVDGIMVARGDLGVEMPFDEVPIVQKMIIKTPSAGALSRVIICNADAGNR